MGKNRPTGCPCIPGLRLRISRINTCCTNQQRLSLPQWRWTIRQARSRRRSLFQVLGDGKNLWKSKPVSASGNVQECEVDITGVDVLELRVDCAGPNTNVKAVWVEARVLLR